MLRNFTEFYAILRNACTIHFLPSFVVQLNKADLVEQLDLELS
jgi:hypothetical protein